MLACQAVLYYSRDVLQDAAVPPSHIRLANAGVGLVKFVGALLSTAAIDRLGRRALLLGGTVVMLAGHLGLAVSFGMLRGGAAPPGEVAIADEGAGGDMTGVLALSSLLIFILAWNVSWAGLMLTVASELLPQEVRGLGCGVAYALYWLLSFIISSTLESTFENVGTGETFALYGGATSFALVFVWVCVPETKGVALSACATA